MTVLGEPYRSWAFQENPSSGKTFNSAIAGRELESLPRIALRPEPGFPRKEPRDNVKEGELSLPGDGE